MTVTHPRGAVAGRGQRGGNVSAKAREIVAEGSAQARLGAALRELRSRKGLSQARLGAAVHCSGDLIRRVEATERFPNRQLIEACDRVLEADGSLLELWVAAEEERRRATSPRKERLQPARFVPEASESLITRWVATDSPVLAELPSSDGLWVTDQDVLVAEATLDMFRRLDHAHGPGHFGAHLSSYIDSELSSLLSRPAAAPGVELDRTRIATGFLELAGYQAVDSGRPGWAQSHYRRALQLTARTGDRAYGGYLVGVNLSHLALHCNHPSIALRWSQAAVEVIDTAASPATRAAITAVSARSHARMGNERETTELLLQAEALLNSSVVGEEPPWISYFTRAYLADEMAHCLNDLGRAPSARTQVADALEGVGPDRVRRLAIDAALLASTWLRSGDIEQACAVGKAAVGYAARTSSGRSVERIARLLVDLKPHAGQTVSELDEYVRAVLPAAAITLSRS
ncbi:helix-turn-helix transcriptional regulator [Streptomyces tateyamensis]|uniref:helix-turn-helix domain-containing protein n=1 Tax=Streptomyces tateyamensis TaxID=565073 RepID=UPI00319E4B4B